MRPLVLFLVLFVFISSFARLGVDPNHDGVILKSAWDMTRGLVLFRDTFSHYGPLTSYLHAAALSLFGSRLLVLKLVTAAAYSLTGVLTWSILRRFTGSHPAVLAVLLWVALAPYFVQHFFIWPSVYGSLLHTLSVWVIFRWAAGSRSARWLFVLGLTAGLAFWFKQTFLILALAIAVPWFIYSGLQPRLFTFASGFLATVLGVLFPITVSGGLPDWFRQNLLIGYINGRILASEINFPSLVRFFLSHPAWVLIPLGGLAGWILGLKAKHPAFIFAGWFSLVSLTQYYPLVDPSHIYWAVTPMFWLFAYFVWWLLGRRRLPYWILASLLFVILGSEISVRISGARQKIIHNPVTITSPAILSGMQVSSGESQYYAAIGNLIARYPGRGFVVMGSEALFMAFTPQAHNTLAMYADYSGITSGVIPYTNSLNEYITADRPLILADGRITPPANYYPLISWPEFDKKFLVPSELLTR